MPWHKVASTMYLIGFLILTFLAFVIQVVAQDSDGAGGVDFSDLVGGFGIAGVVLFALATFTGLVIFLNQRPPFQALFKHWNVKMKIFFKIHHPLTIATIGTWVGHGLVLIFSGAPELSSSGLVIVGVGIVMLLSGLLFPPMKGAARRKVMRYFHLSLMIIIAILVVVHIGIGD
jgi:hypothetical protein